jgi:probable phosphoglycerate mutase
VDALILFRHGQTDHNRERRFQGQLDVPLNSVGREQAARTGALVASCLRSFFAPGLALEAMTSDLSRANETASTVANALAEAGASPLFFRSEPRLREWDCGELRDKTVEEYERERPGVLEEFYAAFERDPWNTPYPGERGEAKRDVAARLMPLLDVWNAQLDAPRRERQRDDATWAKMAQKACLVSSHGGVIHVFLELLRCPLATGDRIIGNGDVLIVVPTADSKGTWRILRHYRVGDNVAAAIKPG